MEFNYDLSAIIATVVVGVWSIYIILLAMVPKFRIEVNELLSEIFDASMSDKEKENLGPAVVVPPTTALMVLGGMFLLLNIVEILPVLPLTAFAVLYAGHKRKKELQLDELKDLGDLEL